MNGENISIDQNPSMRLVTRRKFIGVAALSGAGVASLSAHDQLARAAEIDGVMEQHEMLSENRMTEEINKEKIRRATLAGPSSVTSDATVAEMDRHGTMTCFGPAPTNGFVFQEIRTLLDGQTWPSIRWVWFGSRIFLPESQNQRIRPQA
jgi:hypothetical protein